MIEKYQIKQEQEGEVLYLYLNYDYEFGNLNIFSNLKKYLKNNKIEFNGKKIILVASGIAFASIILTKPLINQPINDDKANYVSSIILKEFDIDLNETGEEKYNIVSSTNQETQKIYTEESKTQTTKKPNTNKTTDIINNKNNDIKNNTTTENLTYVTIYRSNGKVEKIELEEYIIGVVAGEMPASFNTEALKAQSVLARTYALKSLQDNKRLTDTVATQVYKDTNQLKSIWGNEYDKYYNKIKNAVLSTQGESVQYGGNYIEALYHSTSNGYTEDAINVWGNSYPYLKTVESPYDKNVNSYEKQVSMAYDTIMQQLGIDINKASQVTYIKNDSNRVNTITIDSQTISGIDFRTKLGLRSTDFELKLNENDVTIITKGYGHGVGMSQYGANEMAKRGATYKEIIKYYYKGVQIIR